MRGGAAGRSRERQVAERLRSEGWCVIRGTTYGVADLAALRAGETPMIVEVKSTAVSPYEHFGPAARETLALEAARAGARAVLAWWAPRKPLVLIPSSEWPT